MTYEERENHFCDNCEAKENCSYISRNLERKCTFKETVMYGWELGYKDALEKASLYVYHLGVHPNVAIDGIELEKHFKKYMEE